MNEYQQTTLTALHSLDNLRTRLLDLSARNRLLNFRHSGTGNLRIIDELPDQLHELLLSEAELRFSPVSEPTQEQLIKAGYIQINEQTRQEMRIKKSPTAEEWARWLNCKPIMSCRSQSIVARRQKSIATGPSKHCFSLMI